MIWKKQKTKQKNFPNQEKKRDVYWKSQIIKLSSQNTKVNGFYVYGENFIKNPFVSEEKKKAVIANYFNCFAFFF